MKKYIYLLASMLMVLIMQSCFQDMDAPPFDYPEDKPAPKADPLLLKLAFEDNVKDTGKNGCVTSTGGGITYGTGITGKAYKGSANAYVLANISPDFPNTLEDLGSFTLSFWMKSTATTGAVGIFSIASTDTFWGNLDVFIDGNRANPQQAFFKVHILDAERKDKWIEHRIDNFFVDQWIHLAFRYNEANSTFTIFKDGVSVKTQVLDGLGRLKFTNVGPMVMGTLQFMTTPSLTTNTGKQDWGGYYPNLLDQLFFYNKALTDAEIQKKFSDKE